jgi:hypothetical protein
MWRAIDQQTQEEEEEEEEEDNDDKLHLKKCFCKQSW